ncbi:light-harvesting antenna LH1, beta subunit [Roseospira visakhapatnamensis]|uniref:Light-harvesting complex 1 beta chain n=1 Tax=Roseospira visakhapatnamensis TaxID=390880 RepID=A0A7W6RBM7_9PROT|nr:light-harvesting antenna LH1, beta subunit [Roseospira visakhapatnamensis]MBB4265555.1 light-harvesting complex 1 beta chain [Roseospira visakhapatnamensis]
MADAPSYKNLNRTGLTDDEAKAFHAMFQRSGQVFFALCLVAHFLVWAWMPWFPAAS